MRNDNGGPAFPTEIGPDTGDGGGFQSGNERWQFPGMTLRDYFAAKAMQGCFMSPIDPSHIGKEYIAMHCYQMADEMLKARSQ